jgi:hypothetical protein
MTTTVVALLGVWWLENNTTSFHVMGWYADYVIPAGALIVGMVAGSGYGIASHCEGCELYMKSRTVALMPAGVRSRRIAKKDVAARAAFQQEHDRAAQAAAATLRRVTDLAARGDALAIKAALADHPAKGPQSRRTNRLPARLRFGLVRCRQCSSGFLQPAMITGQGRGIRVQSLDRVALPADATRIVADN